MKTKGPVASPCNDVCRIDEHSGRCLGCCRTLDEIARWSTMSDARKRAVLDALPERRRMLPKQAGAGEAGR
jgi:uncharacterized protein